MEKIESIPARVKVSSIIRKAILAGEFPAGSELSLTDMAEKLGVSRTPVREAFQTLASEGLIELRMNRGAVVKSIDEEFIRDHFEIRALLEGEATYRAIRNGLKADRFRRLQNTVETDELLANGAAFNNYNNEFHTTIWKAANSKKLYSFCEMLWNGPSYSRALEDTEHRRKSLKEHEKLILCTSRGDAERGREAMREHILRSMENILAGFHIT